MKGSLWAWDDWRVMNDTRDRLSKCIDEVLSGEPVVAAAYLYGSVGRNAATPHSDVDLAVVLDEQLDVHARGEILRRLNMLLRRACPGAEFDVRCLGELPVAVAGRVVTEGTCVFERNAARRVAAEVRARMLYHDFLPFERQGTSEGLAGLRGRLGLG